MAEIDNLVDSAMVDGVIVMEVEVHDPRVPELRALNRPVVPIGTPADADHLVNVDFDFTAAGAMCVHCLHDLGHANVGVIGQSEETYARELGYATNLLARRVATSAAALCPRFP